MPNRSGIIAFEIAALLAVANPAPAQPAASSTIDVVARDYALDVPAHTRAGLLRIRFRNGGREPHYLRVVRVDGTHTLDDFRAWRERRTALPEWLVPSGGVGTIAAGEAVEYAARLPAGRYIAYCGHPSPDGVPHVDKGMFAELTLDESDVRASDPVSAVSLALKDDGMDLSAPLRRGSQTVKLHNAGTRSHQALIVRLPDGVSVGHEVAWFRGGSQGSRPGHPVGGAIEVLPGTDAWITIDLAPGSYVVLSTAAGPTGIRDFDAGLLKPFAID